MCASDHPQLLLILVDRTDRGGYFILCIRSFWNSREYFLDLRGEYAKYSYLFGWWWWYRWWPLKNCHVIMNVCVTRAHAGSSCPACRACYVGRDCVVLVWQQRRALRPCISPKREQQAQDQRNIKLSGLLLSVTVMPLAPLYLHEPPGSMA